MKVRTVRMITIAGGQVPVDWRPRWSDEAEIPLYTMELAEADLLVYGSGTVEVRMLELPITARLPVAVTGGLPHRDVPRDRWRELLMQLKKITPSEQPSSAGGAGVADGATWPALVLYMSATEYPGGGKRQPASVTLLCGSEGWKGCVSDKDNGRVLWKTAATLEGLLLSLEQALMEDDPSSWRQSSEARWKGRKKS